MRSMPLVSALTIVAFLSAGVVRPAIAAPPPVQPSTATASPLRASIERAATAAAQVPGVPARRPGEARKQMTPGGGGGGGMMLMTLLVTAASLAGTYFLVKEMKKSTDEATKTAQ
jgi:hypothetical protein